ncbi:hypothetical protein GCM10025864_06960 [Luteimicrobium album]|uniref:Fibronectin type-III domain-containing protein n=1 Tax=Luteimicrobium album TaxID=1054550 RepID=A0ABQ6HY76_9MICO|nr:hypothetical protein [Luteimicrobium album]GMA22937.1 hypothetical protein GCM10025864_06960 [Luteimicrobium album]
MVVVTPAPVPEAESRPRILERAARPPRRPVVPRRLWVPRDRPASAPEPPGFAQSLAIPDGAVTLPAVMRRIAGLTTTTTTTTLTEVAAAVVVGETAVVAEVVEETVVPALLLAPPRAPVVPSPVPSAPPAPPTPQAEVRWSPPPAPPSSAPLPTRGARPWRRRHPRLRLAFLLLLATLVAAGVLLVSRGDGITPAPAPTALTAANITFDGADVRWQPTGDRATAYLVRVATDPALRHVVWTRTVDAADPHVHVGGRGITEDQQLYVAVTSTWHGVTGSTTQPLAVHTPLRPPSPVTDVVTRPDTSGVTVSWGRRPARPATRSSSRATSP